LTKTLTLILSNSWCPVWQISRQLLVPLKWQTSGSILASHQVLTNSFAINSGGGFHPGLPTFLRAKSGQNKPNGRPLYKKMPNFSSKNYEF
jgi:hypothetical protein